MKLAKKLSIAGLCVVLGLTTCGIVMAQNNGGGRGGRGGGNGGGGNFDPAAMQERQLDRATTNLGLSDAEAKVIVPKIQRLLSARFANLGDMTTLRNGLNDLVQDKKSSDSAVKKQLDKYKSKVNATKKSLEDAEADLKSVLSVKQEAELTLLGIINSAGGGFGGGGFGGGRGGNRGGGGGGGRGGNAPSQN